VVNYAILLPNVLMQGVQIVTKTKFLRKKINIRKEIRKEINEDFLKRKACIQKMMIVTMNQEEYSSWH
jgi:hypothetical protein